MRRRHAPIAIVLACLAWSGSALADPPPPASAEPLPPTEAPPPTAPVPAEAPVEKPAPSEVVVKGAKADALQRSSGSGTVITSKDIKRAAPQSTGEILRRTNGLVVRQEDAMGLRLNVGVRGLSPTRSRLVLVQEDGVPVVVSPYGEPELYYSTPVERVTSIDVVKGSGSLLYGPQTLGGALLFRTPAPSAERSWVVDGGVGTYGYRRLLLRYGDASGDVRYVVQAMRKQGDGFRGMAFDATDFMAKVLFPTSERGEATAKVVLYDETSTTTYVGLTQAMYERDPRQRTVAPDDRFAVRRYEVSLAHEHAFDDRTRLRSLLFFYTTALRFRLQDFDRKPSDDIAHVRIEGDQRITFGGLYFRNTTSLRDRRYDVFGVEEAVDHRFQTSYVVHKLTIGGRAILDVANRRLSTGGFPTASGGDLRSDSTTTIYGLAAYARDAIAFRDDIVVTPGVRLEHSRGRRDTARVDGVDVAATGRTSATGVMPGIGMIVGSPALNVFGSMHSGYSPPRVSQALTANGTDTDLSAERSINHEIGMHARPTKWSRLEGTGFLVNFDNQLVSNNTRSGSDAEFKNGGRTRHLGTEALVAVAVGKGLALPIDLDLAGRYTWVRSRFIGGFYDGNAVPYAPQHTINATLDAEHGSGLGGQVAWTHVSTQFADETNAVEPSPDGVIGRIPAFDVVDVAARYKHKSSGLSATLTVKNALNQVYVSSRLPNGIFTAGFRWIGVALRWEK